MAFLIISNDGLAYTLWQACHKVYAHADTELKRKAIEKAIPEDSPLKDYIKADRYKIDDDDVLKQLCGLK